MKKEIINWTEAKVPEATESYAPVSHMFLMDVIRTALNGAGYDIVNNIVRQSHNGEEITGTMLLRKAGDEMGLPFERMFGYMNSYNKRLPIKLAAGAYVFICTNGMVVGDIYQYRKHTSGVVDDLTRLVDEAVVDIEKSFKRATDDYFLMKSTNMTLNSIASELGMLTIRKEIISITELSIIMKELKKPTFPAFSDRSVWSLYNHCTYALKDARPARRLDSLKKLHDYFVEYCNANKEISIDDLI